MEHLNIHYLLKFNQRVSEYKCISKGAISQAKTEQRKDHMKINFELFQIQK